MAQQQIITKPYVGELQNGDSLFINHDGALRQVSVPNADLARHTEIEAEIAAREEFEEQETAAREEFEEQETAAREEFEADIQEQMSEKANVDGYYEEMTVGDAEQLVATQFAQDDEPYLFRPTGGSADVGNRAYLDAIIGGTVAWNQLVTNGDFTYDSYWIARKGSLSISDGIATVTATEAVKEVGLTANSTIYGGIKANHKYLISADVKPQTNNALEMSISGGANKNVPITANVWTKAECVWTYPSNYSGGYVYLLLKNAISIGETVQFKNVNCIDLTQMFGSAIADYVYSLEQATAGAGAAWFRKLFPADYYEYSASELISVEGLESHDTVEFNQWDEEWESGTYNWTTGEKVATSGAIRSKNYIPCFQNTEYCVGAPDMGSSYVRFAYYDSNKSFISASSWQIGGVTITTPTNCCYMRFAIAASVYGTVYNHDICINLSWSGYRNGEYEEYVKHSYLLDISITLRGIPRLDASNNLYFDGDTYEPDGTVTRKYGIVDLGTLPWWYRAKSGGVSGFDTTLSGMKKFTGLLICSKYTTTPSNVYSTSDMTISTSGYHYTDPEINIFDSHYTDAATFKAAMSGVYLIYELATPTTEEAEPYQQIQIVDDFGTEEFVSNSIVPVGHMTEYPANLRDKLQHLPDLASIDGTYLIQQSGKQMSLVYMPAVFPEIPTEDGTYTLKTVVASGVATLQWVAD